jgi:RHS repeat-associated protein
MSAGSMNYTWIDNDRMAQVSGPSVLVNYAYDYNGQRISETSAGSTKKYLIDYQLPYGQVIAETDNSGNLVADYVYGLERISQSHGGNVHFYAADGQGSTRQLTDGNGNVTDSWTFDAFGNTINRTGTTENSFLYVGEGFDPNCGFYNLRARWYNPTNGRFTSVDPYEGDPQAAVSLHRYLYAKASPINYSDPTGLFGIDECMAAIDVSNILAINVQPTLGINSLKVIAFSMTAVGWSDWDFTFPALQCKFDFKLSILGKKEDCIIKQQKKGSEIQGGILTQNYASYVDDPYLDWDIWDGNNWNPKILTNGEWNGRNATWSDRPGIPLTQFPVYKDMKYRTIVKNKKTGTELSALEWGIFIDISSPNNIEYYFTF